MTRIALGCEMFCKSIRAAAFSKPQTKPYLGDAAKLLYPYVLHELKSHSIRDEWSIQLTRLSANLISGCQTIRSGQVSTPLVGLKDCSSKRGVLWMCIIYSYVLCILLKSISGIIEDYGTYRCSQIVKITEKHSRKGKERPPGY